LHYSTCFGEKLSKEEILEARHYAQKLKYPKGALVFNGTDEDDFLYCLPDNKEISVCPEIAKSMGFSNLEEGLSAMSKDDLADSLAYNNIKVQKLLTLKFETKYFIVMLNSFFFFQGLILMSHPALRNKARCISYMRQEDNIYNNRVYRDKCHKTSEYLLHSGRLITK
jgi:hypothetical protein